MGLESALDKAIHFKRAPLKMGLLAMGAISLTTSVCMPLNPTDTPKTLPEFTLHTEGSCAAKPPTLTSRDRHILDIHIKTIAGILEKELSPEMIRYIKAPQKVSQLKDIITFSQGRDFAAQVIRAKHYEAAYCHPFVDSSATYDLHKVRFTYKMSDQTTFVLQDNWLRRVYQSNRFRGMVLINFYRPLGVYDDSDRPLTSGYDLLVRPINPLPNLIPYDQLEWVADSWYTVPEERTEEEPIFSALPVGPNNLYSTRVWKVDGNNKTVVYRTDQLGQVSKVVRFPSLAVVPGF